MEIIKVRIINGGKHKQTAKLTDRNRQPNNQTDKQEARKAFRESFEVSVYNSRNKRSQRGGELLSGNSF